MKQERSSFTTFWREIAENTDPTRARFLASDANRGDRRNRAIVDATGTLAMRTLSSGMMAGITSPARQWFRLTTPQRKLAENGAVKVWLNECQQILSDIFHKSNLYNVLPLLYWDVGNYATGAMGVEEDFLDVIRCHDFPIGSYMIAKDAKGRINTFAREFRMTVAQLVQEFGKDPEKPGKIDWSIFSQHIKDLYDAGQRQTWIDVVHLIEPNDEYDQSKLLSKYKKYVSYYFEVGSAGAGKTYLTPNDEDKFLRQKGYDYFPILAPRWQVTGEDVYGTSCPGMTALGDIKQLQLQVKRAAQAIEKKINPPLKGPPELINAKVSLLPGDYTGVTERDQQGGLRPIHEVDISIRELNESSNDLRNRINRICYADLFLMMIESDRRVITATEIEERRDEKLIALGPVLEQLNQDLLDPLIDITFDIAQRQGLIPEPPEQLMEMKLKVEYTSMMAQAQKLVGIQGVERFTGFAAQVVEADPNAAVKIDTDQLLDVYADMTSLPPGIVRSDEDVAAIRDQQAQANKAMAQAEMMKQGASAARDLSNASMDNDNALTRLMDQSNAGLLVGDA